MKKTPSVQRGMEAGPHEVATHVGRDHALHGFAEPFGLTVKRRRPLKGDGISMVNDGNIYG
jgi:hypothetical protein